MMQALGAATPPEVFLYRGNAYYALGAPYLALADYHIASEVLRFAPTHELACTRALALFPRTQTLTYGASNATLHLYVTPYIHDACTVRSTDRYTQPRDAPVAAATSTTKTARSTHADGDAAATRTNAATAAERGVFARQRLRAGTTVVRAVGRPWLRYAMQDGCCTHCARRLSSRVFACPNAVCHEAYCSRECRAQAWGSYHGAVCNNAEFQAIELDVHATWTRLRDAHAAAAASTRAMSASSSCHSRTAVDDGKDAAVTVTDVENQLLMLRVMAAAMHNRCAPSALGELRLLRGRLVACPAVLGSSLLQLYERVVRALRVRTTVSYEELLGVLARVSANRLPRCSTDDDDGDDDDDDDDDNNTVGAHASVHSHHGRACYGDYVELRLPHALLNHSCEANAGFVRASKHAVDGSDRDDDARRSSSSSSSSEDALDRDARAVATLCAVAADEEVTVCYAPDVCHLADVHARRAVLRRRLGFDCRCTRCLRELDAATTTTRTSASPTMS